MKYASLFHMNKRWSETYKSQIRTSHPVIQVLDKRVGSALEMLQQRIHGLHFLSKVVSMKGI